jgi:hypothetical protein
MMEEDIKRLRLEVWQRENPEGVKELEIIIKKKIVDAQAEIERLIEEKIDNYFKNKKYPPPSYVG